MKTYRSAILLLLTITTARADESADKCRDILIYAAHNINQSFKTTDMASDVKNAICTEGATTGSTSTGGSGGLVVFGVFGLKGGGSRQQINEIKNRTCSNAETKLSNQDLDKALTNMVDHESVNAWSQCMLKQGSGLIGSVERNDDIVLLNLRWVSAFNIDQAVIETVTTSGVVCESIWPAGKVVKSASQILQCVGSPSKAVSVTVQTDRGGIVLKSPIVKVAIPSIEIVPDAAVRPDIDLCYDGNIDICERLSSKNIIKCSQDGGPLDKIRACQQYSVSLNDISASIKETERFCKTDQEAPACRESKTRLDLAINVLKSPPAPFPSRDFSMPPRPPMPSIPR